MSNDLMAAWLKKLAAKTGLQSARVANVADYGDDEECTSHAIPITATMRNAPVTPYSLRMAAACIPQGRCP